VAQIAPFTPWRTAIAVPVAGLALENSLNRSGINPFTKPLGESPSHPMNHIGIDNRTIGASQDEPPLPAVELADHLPCP